MRFCSTWMVSMKRMRAGRLCMMSELVRTPSPKNRTPFISVPSVTPVAAKTIDGLSGPGDRLIAPVENSVEIADEPVDAWSLLAAMAQETIAMIRGLRSFDPRAMELMRSYAASRWSVFWKLRMPASLPYLFTALKISATASIVGAIVGEGPGQIRDGCVTMCGLVGNALTTGLPLVSPGTGRSQGTTTGTATTDANGFYVFGTPSVLTPAPWSFGISTARTAPGT